MVQVALYFYGCCGCMCYDVCHLCLKVSKEVWCFSWPSVEIEYGVYGEVEVFCFVDLNDGCSDFRDVNV